MLLDLLSLDKDKKILLSNGLINDTYLSSLEQSLFYKHSKTLRVNSSINILFEPKRRTRAKHYVMKQNVIKHVIHKTLSIESVNKIIKDFFNNIEHYNKENYNKGKTDNLTQSFFDVGIKELGVMILNKQIQTIKKAVFIDIEDNEYNQDCECNRDNEYKKDIKQYREYNQGIRQDIDQLTISIGFKELGKSKHEANNKLVNSLLVFNVKKKRLVLRLKIGDYPIRTGVLSLYFLVNKGVDIDMYIEPYIEHADIEPYIEPEIKSNLTSIKKRKGFKLHAYRFIQHADSRVRVNALLTTGNYFVMLNELFGNRSKCETNIRVIKRGFEKSVLDYYSIHKAVDTSNKVVIKSLTKQDSRVMVRGLVRVDKQATNTNAFIDMKALKLGNSLVVQIPRLEINNNNVVVSHSASVQSPSIDELFYLQSRGLSKEKALNQICEAFIQL